mgnify:CR=1 FL=1
MEKCKYNKKYERHKWFENSYGTHTELASTSVIAVNNVEADHVSSYLLDCDSNSFYLSICTFERHHA